ncbi:MAG: hypothetical protein JNM57_07310 [Cyclobacteriaceae bacterium]|nr:hypothetical protein [Cyclobacteriaceae bacterium]
MKSFAKYLILVFFGALACTEDESVPVDIGKDYLPLQKGIYQVYNIQETQYTGPANPVVSAYQLMTEVVDSFPTTGGGYTYVVYRSTRPDASAAWVYHDTWSIRVDNQRALVTEGNKSIVKIAFPVREGKSWNANEFNITNPDSYKLLDVKKPITVATNFFENTIRIEQENNEDLIVEQDVRYEVYAKNIGLIQKEITQLKYCTQVNCLGQQQIESGIVFIQTIESYGKK